MTSPFLSPKEKAIIFDLDDTLVDTFTSLIVPLEMKAVREMVAAGMSEADEERVVALILQLRRDDPNSIEEILLREFPNAAGYALTARRSVLANASPDKLTIDPRVKYMIQGLSNRYDQYLVTTGPSEFQRRKIEQLGIGELFRDVVILSSDSEETKESWLGSLIHGRCQPKYHPGYYPNSLIVVGNRLDNEIQAGNKLGMTTVWVKSGEGSGLLPNSRTGQPTYSISTIHEIPQILGQVESSGALL